MSKELVQSVLDLVPDLSQAAQSRICTTILQETRDEVHKPKLVATAFPSRSGRGIIPAIKGVREVTRLSLRDAKDLVEGVIERQLLDAFDVVGQSA